MLSVATVSCPECGNRLTRTLARGHETLCPHCEAILASDARKNKSRTCRYCHAEMRMIYGAGWDYDRWICPDPQCDYEIELSTSTHVDMEGDPL